MLVQCATSREPSDFSQNLPQSRAQWTVRRAVLNPVHVARNPRRSVTNQAWDFDGEQVTASPPSEDDDDPAPRRMNGSSDAENNDSSSSSSSSNSDMPSGSGDAVRRRHRSGRTRRRDERSWDFEHEDADDAEFFESSNLYDDPPMEGGEVGRGVWGGGRRSSSSSSSSRGNSGDVGEAFEPRRGKQRPPKTNQDAAEAAGAGIVAALMEVGALS